MVLLVEEILHQLIWSVNIPLLTGFHTCQVHGAGFLPSTESLIRRLQVASLELMSSNTVVATATGVPGNQVPMAGPKMRGSLTSSSRIIPSDVNGGRNSQV